MYEQVFQFKSRPFTATPYVKHYFEGDAIHQSLGQARLCIDRGSGPVVIVGATGTGKSLLLAMLEEQYRSQYNIVNLGCARLNERQELLQSVLYELKLPFKDLSETELRFSLIDHLKPSEHCPNGILLLVDEAHSLSADMLDEIRLITNFVRDGQPRVRLVMAGGQRLEENLNESRLESFNQRIAARCYLRNMSRDETARYVTVHIDRAGGDGDQLFHQDSLRAIHDVSDGCPRLINQVCDHALILAATRTQNVITGDCIQEAWADIQSIPVSFKPSASSPESASELNQDESWTVIEFGQLDENENENENAANSDNGTDYEFENTTPELGAEPLDVVPDLHEAGEETSQMEQDDPEQVTDATENGNGSQSWEEAFDEAQVIETDCASTKEGFDSFANTIYSDQEDACEETQLNSEQRTDAELALDRHAEIDDANVAAAEKIETELVGVSAADEREPELSPGNAEITDLELEHEQILDHVESEQAITFGNQADSGTTGVVVTVNANETEFEPEHSVADQDREDAVLGDATDSHQSATQVTVEDVTSYVFADDNDASGLKQVSEFPDSEIQGSDEVRSAVDDAEEVASAQPRLRQTVETVDPFDESFVEEENLIDRYAPFVAHQNQSSLDVTSEDLAMLTPRDEPEEKSGHAEPTIFEFDHPSSDSTDNSVQPSLVDMDLPLPYETEVSGADSDHCETASDPIADQAESVDQSDSDLPSIESDDQQKMQPESTYESNSELMGETTVEELVPEEGEFHNHDDDLVTQDVRLQAEEILKRLKGSQVVSCETSSGESANEDSDAVDGMTELDQQVAQAIPEGVDSTDLPLVSPVDSDFEMQNTALDKSKQILNEILEHRNALTQLQESSSSNQSPAPTRVDPSTSSESLPLPTDYLNDDQEMIIVSRMEQQSDSQAANVEEPIPFPTTPVSTGRAERMDYQKLFNQLRDISNAQD